MRGLLHRYDKVIKYIKRDQHRKLRRFLKEEKIDLDEILTKRGEKMLHIAAKEGAANCLEYLLEHGANAKLVDKKGNLPIHRALEFVINDFSKENERDIVSTLLTFSSGLMNIRNHKGFTPKELVLQLDKIRARACGSQTLHQSTNKDSAMVRDTVKLSEDDEWRHKLAEECEFEYESFLGRYERDHTYIDEASETYDDWADRIYNAFLNKRRSRVISQVKEEKSKKRPSLKPEIDLHQAAANYKRLKEIKMKKNHLLMCEKLFHSQECISLQDIPFDKLDASQIIEIILDGLDCSVADTEAQKKAVREAIRKWHPDKFQQKMGGRIIDSEKILVMERVKQISQVLTSFGR